MNIQETCRTKCTVCSGIDRAIAFFGLILALVIGLILGAIYYETIFPALPAVIAFAAAIASAIIALLIYRWCDWLKCRR